MELVSIIMPTYNCGEYIRESIDSVLAQSYTAWELLIVDDCSDDDTEAIVHTYDDPRIRYHKNAYNMGAAKTRNQSLAEARGKYIAFLDSDDLWMPDKLEKQIAFMQQNNYAFTYHEYEEIDEQSRLIGVHVSGKRHVSRIDMMSCCWPGCLTVMFDKQTIGVVQINDIRKNNDSALWLNVVQYADCYLLPETLAKYRRRPGSITPTSIWKRIVWHYILFRQGLQMNPLLSLFWTAVNIVVNSYKKIFYIKRYKVQK